MQNLIKPEKTFRSIRKSLANLLEIEAHNAFEITGRSINDLPEYYLSVKAAEHLHKSFETFSFSMEDTVESVIESVEVDKKDIEYIPRRSGKIDLTVRGQKNKKIKHLIEFKRGFRKSGHEDDLLRLAAFCRFSPSGHRTEKNFMVVVATGDKFRFEERTEKMQDSLKDYFGKRVQLKAEYVDLSKHHSTRKNLNRTLYGVVWELAYVA